jgi:hypothetical protein
VEHFGLKMLWTQKSSDNIKSDNFQKGRGQPPYTEQRRELSSELRKIKYYFSQKKKKKKRGGFPSLGFKIVHIAVV